MIAWKDRWRPAHAATNPPPVRERPPLQAAQAAPAAPAAVIVHEQDVMRQEPPPHGAIGQSTAYWISDAVAGRAMEFRRRVLHVGAAIGLHPIDHDEVCYVLSGEGDVSSDGVTNRLTPRRRGLPISRSTVGIKQVGTDPLAVKVAP